MINAHDILETIRMIQEENLDVRTITMGISLLDCCDSNIDRVCERVYNKITTRAARLVEVGQEIEKQYGVPIINKRISVTPIAMILAACEDRDELAVGVVFGSCLDSSAEVAVAVNCNFHLIIIPFVGFLCR